MSRVAGRTGASRSGGWRHAVEVALRALAAVVGGYLLLPFSRPDRVVAGALLALPVWCAAAVYAFAARDWRRGVGLPLALALAMLGLAALLAEQALRP